MPLPGTVWGQSDCLKQSGGTLSVSSDGRVIASSNLVDLLLNLFNYGLRVIGLTNVGAGGLGFVSNSASLRAIF